MSKTETKSKLPVFISGSINLESVVPILERKIIETPFGSAEGYRSEKCWVILRHKTENRIPPHLINHQANLSAAKQLGSFAIGIGSVGSLDPDISPGMLGIPDDIFSPHLIETVSTEENRIHVVPEFNSFLRKLMLSDLSFAGIEVIDGGVYAQTRGPRFESKSEIQWLSDFAHYVGMTCASELTIACELQLPYALLVSIDNWGNGLGPRPLTLEEYLMGVEINHDRVCQVVEFILPSLVRAAETGLGNHS